MPNELHLQLLEQGRLVWNDWRLANPEIRPDLRAGQLAEADLKGMDFTRADLREADLRRARLDGAILRKALLTGADLRNASLRKANLSWARLRRADLRGADLGRADLTRAQLMGARANKARFREADLTWANASQCDLRHANLKGADLNMTILTQANLAGANLSNAHLVRTRLAGANLSNCFLYGISAWELELDGALQSNLTITPSGQPPITVDSVEVAQFIHLLLNNEKIRDVIDTITSKVVLILGRFTPERKAILNAIREELRNHNYLPVLFDFERPGSRDLTETVSTLAHLARFVIADITEAKSIPQELQAIVPTLAVPVKPLLASSDREYGVFSDLPKKYHWVLGVHLYEDVDDLLGSLGDRVIGPAEAKARELEQKRLLP